MNVCQVCTITRLLEMRLLAQVPLAAPGSDIGGNTIEQAWDRPWPWPMWLTIVIVVAVCAAVGVLYYSESGRASSWRRGSLAALRIAALLLVWWMLAGWSIQRFNSDLPELVILIDDSASMQTADSYSVVPGKTDSRASRWETAKQVLQQLTHQDENLASRRYRSKLVALSREARTIAAESGVLGEALGTLSPSGEESRLGDGLIQVLQRQSGRPTVAILILTDGIVTAGAPLEEAAAQARRSAIPVYAIATGEQLPQPDLALTDLLVDDAVVLGDRVNVQVSVAASDIAARKATVNLRDMQSGRIVDSTQVDLSSVANANTAELSFVPSAPGSSLIKLEAAAATNEKNLENNTLERVIEVRDQTLRVLLLQKSPSFEFRFLKTLLERTSQLGETERRAFELDVVLQDADASHVSQDKHALRLVPGDRETIESYDVVVIGEIDPSLIASSTQQMIVDHVATAGCGLIFVCHPGFDIDTLSLWPLGRLLPIDTSLPGDKPWIYDGTPRQWQPTRLGETALPLQLTNVASAEEMWQTLPGPQWHFSPGGLTPGAHVLAAAVASDGPRDILSPLLITQFVGAGRVALQTNDETYRWIGYRGSDLTYERYWVQMLRWLSRGKLNRQDRSELAVEPRQAKVGQPLQFTVRLSPDAATSLGIRPAIVTVQRIGGESKTITLQRTQSAGAQFKANEATLASGSYRATLTEPAEAAANSVTFTVTSPPGEQSNLRSDWAALQSLAELTHGKFFVARDANDLLRELPKGSPVRRGALPALPLWNSAWVAAAFVILLSLEWIVRRTANML